MITTFTPGKLNAGENWIDMRPKYIDEGVGSAMYVHSSGGVAEQALSNDGSKLSFLMQKIVDSGFTGGSGDFGGPYTWGNGTAISRLLTAKNYLDGKPGVNGKTCLVATSMGAVASLAFAARYPGQVSCIVLGLPVLDVSYVAANNVNGNAANINAAYGGWSESTYGAKHNPMTMAKAGKYNGLPILIFNGQYDPLSDPSKVAEFKGYVGSTCEVVTLPYGHVGAAYAAIDHQKVVDFVNTHNR